MLSVLVVLHVRVGVCVLFVVHACMCARVHACMCARLVCVCMCVSCVCVCRACIDQRSIGVVSGTRHHIAEWCREALREALRELSGRLSGLEHGTILRSIPG